MVFPNKIMISLTDIYIQTKENKIKWTNERYLTTQWRDCTIVIDYIYRNKHKVNSDRPEYYVKFIQNGKVYIFETICYEQSVIDLIESIINEACGISDLDIYL